MNLFLELIKATLYHNKNGKIVIILDNAKIHHAKLLKPFLEQVKDKVLIINFLKN